MKNLIKNKYFWCCTLLFLGHQYLEKHLGYQNAFLDSYLDDLLCLPILLWGWQAEQMDLFKRTSLHIIEVLGILLLVGFIFEQILPRYFVHYTADFWDWVCYLIGALFYILIERKRILFSLVSLKPSI